MVISIDKEALLASVKMRISIIARDSYDSQGNSMYVVLVPTERDNDMLEDLYASSLVDLASSVKRVSPLLNGNSITLELPNFDDSLTPLINNSAESYIKNVIVGSWLKLKGSDSFSAFAENSASCLSEFKNLVFTKCASVISLNPVYDIVFDEIEADDTEVSLSVSITVDGKEDSVTLFSSRYACGFSLYAFCNSIPLGVDYNGGKVTGFTAKAGDKFVFELRRYSKLLCRKEATV